MGDPAPTDTVGLQWPEPGTRWRFTRPAESMGWHFQPGDEVVVLDTVSHLDWFALLVELRGTGLCEDHWKQGLDARRATDAFMAGYRTQLRNYQR